MATTFKNRKTPGVYITELDAVPQSVVGVPTAIPAFIGYTETAVLDGKAALLQPVLVSSMADFERNFGKESTGLQRFNLYYSMQLFYANGGSNCYVVAVGNYSLPVSKDDLLAGLTVIAAQTGPTMLVIPEAVYLPAIDEFAEVANAMLNQCGVRQDRVAILDVYGADEISDANVATTLEPCIAQFQNAIASSSLSYGMAYFPFLNTSITGSTVLPPSAAMAGVFTISDQTNGVWNAPANVSLAGTLSVSVNLSDARQGELNAPLNGKAIDVIRSFPGRGQVVWGARTLDGNSQDWRYIQVRRTIIYVEQSIKGALSPFVFAANEASTWSTVQQMISSFLHGLWSSGGLIGASASDAYTVSCGVPATMTAADILNGYMVVQVTLQMAHPAEFIELTFQQTMQSS